MAVDDIERAAAARIRRLAELVDTWAESGDEQAGIAAVLAELPYPRRGIVLAAAVDGLTSRQRVAAFATDQVTPTANVENRQVLDDYA